VLISWLESGKAADIRALDLDSSDNVRSCIYCTVDASLNILVPETYCV